MSKPREVFETETHGDTLVLIPFGEQVRLRPQEIQRHADEIVSTIRQGDVRNVVLDGSEVSYLSSAVISAFIQMWEAAEEQGGRFVTCNLSDDALQALVVTRLDTRWPRYDSRDEALRELAAE